MSSIELPEGYRFQTTLAAGEYSMLFLAMGNDYQEVAIKSFDCTQMDDAQVSEIHRQALLLKSVNHPLVLKVYDVQMNITRTRLHVIMEPFFKTLQNLIDECEKADRSLLNNIVCQVAYQVIKGLHYLSTTNHVAVNEQGQEFSQDKIFHSFITPNDIVFNTSGVVKLMNIFPLEHRMLYEKGDASFPGLAYASPEFLNREYTECPADVWSAGACIFAMAMRRPPFNSTNVESLRVEVEEGKKDGLDISFSRELDDMLQRMMTPDQGYRPTAGDLLNDPSITEAAYEIEAGGLQNPWMAIGFSRPISQAVAPVSNDSPVLALDPNNVYPIAFDDNNPWERYWLNAPRPDATVDAASYTRGTIGEEVVARVPTPPPEMDMYATMDDAYKGANDESAYYAPDSYYGSAPAESVMDVAQVVRVETPPPEPDAYADAGAQGNDYKVDDEAAAYALTSYYGDAPADSIMLTDDEVVHRIPTPLPEGVAEVVVKRSAPAPVPTPAPLMETAPESKTVTALMNAVRTGKNDVVQRLVGEHSGDIGWKTPNEKKTALMVAADLGNAEAVELLAPCECGEVDSDGWRAIDYAAQNGNVRAVNALLQYEGDMPIVRKDGCTPLFQAVFWNKPDCVRALAPKYAGATTTSHYWQGEGFTALMEAAKCCRVECVEILAPYEAKMTDKKGHTALYHCEHAWDHILDDAKKEECIRILERA
ncbi:Kinase, NEK [Giardia duodenalis]|uniref:Kinase, NEK n=2 Tax=Giardia intestinalis TaxID=5741 RepID=A8BH24_GIAIC|nr:Kinase, NEK [Giardia intestinalis]KAE8301948.1 Kinase, NEK [Giardia intestinalis]|eukprot:XP_001707032.1 Kinase, NEK-frag [Giardia lamblia ATCC 50803]